jgi:uncharacterized membrane protein
MRTVLVIVGLLLVAAGIWVVAGHASYTATETVAKIGSAELTASHDRAIPQWVGIAGIAVGGLIAIGAMIGRRR